MIREIASIELLAIFRMIFYFNGLLFESLANYLSLTYKPLQYSELLLIPFSQHHLVDIELQFSFVGQVGYDLRRYPLDRKFAVMFFRV